MQAAPLKLSRYLVAHDDGFSAILWSTRTGRTIQLPSETWTALQTNCLDERALPFLHELRTSKFLVSAAEVETASIISVNVESAQTDSDLDIVIAPSANCPLGCNLSKYGAYCGQTHSNHQMTTQTAIEIVEFIKRSRKPYHKQLRINWFGGEPLLALQRIREISKPLMSWATEQDISYTSSLVTGGTLLTHEVARECVQALGIAAASISIDGLPEDHDARRCTKGGKPTFARIFENLRDILNDQSIEGFAVSIRCNVDKRNAGSAYKLIDYLAAEGWQSRIDLYFATVHPWGANTNADKMLSAREFAALELGWCRRLIEKGFKCTLIPQRKPIVCRVVSNSRLVIGYTGSIHRCTESPMTPKNLADDEAGDVKTSSTVESVTKWSWHEQLSDDRAPCSACEYLPVCGGACPLSWRTGADVPCPPFKYNGVQRLALLRSNTDELSFDVTSASRSDHSIVGMMQVIAPDDRARAMISALDVDLKGMKRAAPDQCLSLAKELSTQTSNSWPDWRLTKLERAARLSMAAYLYYRDSQINGVVASTLGAIHCLHHLADDTEIDVRSSQIQILVNLLVAQHKLFHTLDEALGRAILDYLKGRRSLRVERSFLSRIRDSRPIPRRLREELRRSTTEVMVLAGFLNCA